MQLLAEHGAHIIVGDINKDAAVKTIGQLAGSHKYVKTDVRRYEDIYVLFEEAYKQHGRIDHAISCAGILEQGNWFDPNLTIDSVREPGNTNVLDVNVLGTLNFARIATVFMRQDNFNAGCKSLTLMSSVNAFRDSPGLFLYQACGILRSIRKCCADCARRHRSMPSKAFYDQRERHCMNVMAFVSMQCVLE